MDGFEWNKIIGAILGTLLFVIGIGFVAEAIYRPVENQGAGYSLPGEADAHTDGTGTEIVPASPLPELLAQASVEAGARQARKCASCHDFAAGGVNKVGPRLYGVVGRPVAGESDYAYSAAFAAMTGTGEVWTYEGLNEYLLGPKDYMPGTKMTFAGIPRDTDRADLLAYLQTLSDNPVPFPAPATPAAAEPAAAKPAAAAPMAEAPAAAAPMTEAPAAAAPMTEAPAAAAGSELAARLAAASAETGRAQARKCAACHSFDAGGPNKVGPPLFGVVGRKAGTMEFAYSTAFKELAASQLEWSLEELDVYLTDPRAYAPGGKMPLATSNAEERANILAYLETLKN